MEHTKSATMKDIARKLNVSITTVSKVVNGHHDISDKKKAEIWAAINEMGYVPNIMAANLRRNKGNMVALILSDISAPYFARVIKGYDSVLNAAGYHSLIFSSMEQAEREEELLQQVKSMNLAGIIIDPAQNSDPEEKGLKQTEVPYVFSNRFFDIDNDYYVAADNQEIGRIATRHLLNRKPGKTIFCVNGPNGISPTVLRYSGFQEEMKEANMPVEKWQVFNNNFDLQDAFQVGKKIAKYAKKQGQCSVFVSTDQLAIGVMRAILESGLSIPEDVAIIGVDDIDVAAYLNPALTTVAIPKEVIGEKSAKLLIELIAGHDVDTPRMLLPPTLMIRETT